MSHKNAKRIIIGSLFLVWSLAATAFLVYREASYRNDTFPVEYPRLPFPVIGDVFSPGDTVELEAMYCPHRSTRYSIVQRIENIDTQEYWLLPEINTFVEQSPCKVVRIFKDIPEHIAAGEYRFCFKAFANGTYKPLVEKEYCSISFPVQ